MSEVIDAGGTVLAATQRLAGHLRWRYHRDRLRRGDDTWPAPRILTLNQWLEQTWEHSLVRGGDAGQLQLLSRAQFLQAVDLVADRVGSDDAAIQSTGARRLLGRSWALAREWGIGTRDLAAAGNTADTRLFASWAAHFENLCRDRGWLDPASLPARLLPEIAGGAVPLGPALGLAGFERVTWSQQRLFDALAGQGALAGRIMTGAPGKRAGARRIEAAELREERRWAAQWARQRLESEPDAAIGVIVPDLPRQAVDFRRSFLDAFDPRWRDRDGTTFPVGIDDGAKLADTGVVHTALLLLRVPSGRIDFREFGQLLRSPYLRGGVSEADDRARLDLSLRAGRMQVVDLRSLCKTVAATPPQQFLGALARMLALAERTRGRREPAAWLPVIESLLREAGLGHGRDLGFDEARALDAWSALLEQFATLGEIVGDISFSAARRLLSEAAQAQALRPTSRADGVQIMSPWEANGHEFDFLWVCGMTSDAWPPVAAPSPLLPIALQRERRIPEALPDLYREQALATLDRLLSCAPGVVVSWTPWAGDEERSVAPRVRALPAVTPHGLGLDSDCDSRGEFLDLRRALLAGPRASVEPDPAPEFAPDERARGGARLVNLQSACPARAFFELRLGARELRSPPFAPDAAARGSLLHDAVEYLNRSLQAAGGPASIPDAAVEEFIADAVGRAIARHVPRAHPLAETLRLNERARLQRLLRVVVARDRERGGFVIAEVEGSHVIDVGGISLTVRYDRVDRSTSGAKLVIDYKTGSHFGMAQCLGVRPLELQLPLYAAYGDADGIALYWLHPDGLRIDALAADSFGILTSGRASKYLLDTDEWSAQLLRWRESLEALVTEFRSGDCRINRLDDRWARGQFAMLTRCWDLAQVVEADEE